MFGAGGNGKSGFRSPEIPRDKSPWQLPMRVDPLRMLAPGKRKGISIGMVMVWHVLLHQAPRFEHLGSRVVWCDMECQIAFFGGCSPWILFCAHLGLRVAVYFLWHTKPVQGAKDWSEQLQRDSQKQAVSCCKIYNHKVWNRPWKVTIPKGR